MQNEKLTHLSLFTGIGGIDLAAEWAGFETVGQCEFAPFPTKILEKNWPYVPRWRDVHDVTAESFYIRTGLRTVDLISGGLPCQPFSLAGNQKGKEDDRYLWPEMLRVIRELTPRWVIGENVPGILSIAGRTVCEDLEHAGYNIAVFDFEAAAVGASHRRESVFFVGNADAPRELQQKGSIENIRGRVSNYGEVVPNAKNELSQEPIRTNQTGVTGFANSNIVPDPDNPRNRTQRHRINRYGQEENEGRQEQPQFESCGYSQVIADTNSSGCSRNKRREHEQQLTQRRKWFAKSGVGGMADGIPNKLDGIITFPQEPDVPRKATGVKDRVDRLKCLGNAVCPQQIYPILQAIADIENENSRRLS